MRLGFDLNSCRSSLQVSSLQVGSFHTPHQGPISPLFLIAVYGSLMGDDPPTKYPPVVAFDHLNLRAWYNREFHKDLRAQQEEIRWQTALDGQSFVSVRPT